MVVATVMVEREVVEMGVVATVAVVEMEVVVRVVGQEVAEMEGVHTVGEMVGVAMVVVATEGVREERVVVAGAVALVVVMAAAVVVAWEVESTATAVGALVTEAQKVAAVVKEVE